MIINQSVLHLSPDTVASSNEHQREKGKKSSVVTAEEKMFCPREA